MIEKKLEPKKELNGNHVSKTVFIHAEFSLTCQVRNASNPVIIWYKDSTYQGNIDITPMQTFGVKSPRKAH